MVRETDLAGLVVPTRCVPKGKLSVDSVAFDPAVKPVPVNDTD